MYWIPVFCPFFIPAIPAPLYQGFKPKNCERFNPRCENKTTIKSKLEIYYVIIK